MKFIIANKKYLIIVIAWMFIYAMAPLYVWYAETLNGFDFNIDRIYGMWMTTTMFLLLYITHHFILVPKFFITKRYAVYAATVCLCMSLFTLTQLYHTPKHFDRKDRTHMHHEMGRKEGKGKHHQ